ncbi:hypothetical protein ACFFJY_08375 [Fictibacillus aquaticus]|uniref:Uncharacterized protein n=1 Tax=Fictibacillus aquaticus TaxID=2021314 RepID=A0A235F9R0_9BACL|nr:hypothetical protein [Fictibacillus aquaticus]OYD57814.1 hypothetical protein CGZ90_07885 [Fictibacillus aquaticus]
MLFEYMDATEKDHYCRLERLLYAGKAKDDHVLTDVRDKLLMTVKERVIHNLSWMKVKEEIDEAAKRESLLTEWENKENRE